MFESNSYHKEWRSREGHKKVSLTSLFVFQITWLEKCNPMIDPIFRYSAPKPVSIWSKTELRVFDSWWFHSVTRVTGVELCQDRSWDPLQHLLGEDPEEEVVSSISLLQNTQSLTLATWATASRCQETQRQYGSHSCPETIMMFKRVEMGLDWGVYLCNEVLLELAKELKVEQVVRGESLFADDRLHGLDVLANGVAGVQLVGNVRVVLPEEEARRFKTVSLRLNNFTWSCPRQWQTSSTETVREAHWWAGRSVCCAAACPRRSGPRWCSQWDREWDGWYRR